MSVDTSLNRVFTLPDQKLTMPDWPAEGYVLNIGGDGAGVIYELKGPSVVAISADRRQLEDGAPGPLKIIMDPSQLQFLDASFGVVTAFFSLLDVPDAQFEFMMREAYRVLVPGGLFRIWDAIVPLPPAGKDLVAFHLDVHMPSGRTIEIAYGSRAPRHDHDLTFYETQFRHSGFRTIEQTSHGNVFSVVLQKPG